MKRFLKIASAVVLACFLCVAAFVGGLSFLSWRSERQLNVIVAELLPGTPLSTAVARLGLPARAISTPDEMQAFDHSMTQSSKPHTTLYLFAHRGPPYRWVLVYSDDASQTIRHAEWQQM